MTDCRTVGEISTFEDRIYWKIPNFPSLSRRVGDFYSSPELQHSNTTLNFRMYPGGIESIPGCILLQIWVKIKSDVEPLLFSLSIRGKDRLEEEVISNQRLDTDASFCSGLLKFMERVDLLQNCSQLIPSGTLVIIFSGGIDESSFLEGKKLVSRDTRAENVTDTGAIQAREHLNVKDGNSTLRKNLEDMLLSGDDHDVTIKVKGQEFKAHKCMLRSRSPVFEAMFKHKMKESTDDSISIEDCHPGSFQEFLYYVYTEKVKNVSLSNAMGLYYAGDKYDFPGLKEICVEFLKASLSTTIITDVITLAIKHGEDELRECAMSFFSKHLEEIMITVEWQRFLLDNPIQANELCLKAVKTGYKKK